MTNQEFSNEFDVLFNNISSNQAPGLNEYEKSIFLTKAQDDLIREYFNHHIDAANGGFDGSQKRQYDFSSLIVTAECTAHTGTKLNNKANLYLFPSDYFLSINEVLNTETTQFSVIPVTYNDYTSLMTKPYAYPPKKVAWRLFVGKHTKTTASGTPTTTTHIIAELLGKYPINSTYLIRYVKKPTPIILIDLDADELSIGGLNEETPCNLPEQMHQEILERAVTLAKIAYQGGSTATIAAQQQAENNR